MAVLCLSRWKHGSPQDLTCSTIWLVWWFRFVDICRAKLDEVCIWSLTRHTNGIRLKSQWSSAQASHRSEIPGWPVDFELVGIAQKLGTVAASLELIGKWKVKPGKSQTWQTFFANVGTLIYSDIRIDLISHYTLKWIGHDCLHGWCFTNDPAPNPLWPSLIPTSCSAWACEAGRVVITRI